MRRLLTGVLVCWACLCWAEDTPDQFAYAMPVIAPAGSGLLRVLIPAEVYEGSARAGLVDLRVFDRLGKVAPFALEPRASSAAREHWLSVATYPMYSKGAVPLSQSRIRLASRGLNMEVEVTGEAAADSSPKRLLRGYVLDVSGVKKAMTGVAFDWDQQDHPLLVASIERGDDLDHWQPIATAVTLARLTAQGQTLLRNEIEFTAAPAKYLRVTFPQVESAPPMRSIKLRVSEDAPSAPRQWQVVSGQKVESGSMDFELQGALPVDRIQLQLDGANAVLPVEVLSRAKAADPWSLVTRSTFYRIEQGNALLASPEVAVGETRHRYWRVQPAQANAALPISALRIGWVPERLVFVAQGEAPFRLAFGNARAQASALPIVSVVPGYGTDKAPVLSDAELGARQVLAGDSAKAERVAPRTWALWAALGAGVALLAWMALSLVRQLKAPKT